ncbi:acetylserotonin O-methyltransferase [Nocardia sp. alder85J]|uniref:acetylserotonin O-methyltransferase n=1 Tax=Nocardia sp. alder85J TaxID=2862949 RepID=UPI001CD6998F|nr:acetylserotonin O-methyltransferase [Nocardia sp. alder85J]MCX4092550.1 methyltransferase [Nocardia sp. alder85J]
MLVRRRWAGKLDRADSEVVEQSLSFVRDTDADSVLAGLAPGLSEYRRAQVVAHCTLAHAAVLVFPASTAELIEDLRADGLAVDGAIPSVVVRERLGRRYGVDPAHLDVSIVNIRVPAVDGELRAVELFALAAGPDLGTLAGRERLERNEFHVALEVAAPDDVVVAGLRSLLIEEGGLTADGSGYNAVEDCTVLYFRGAASAHGYRRLELRIHGRYDAALRAHRTAAPEDRAIRLLELMTGAWATSALATAAELGVADALADGAGGSIDELADRLAVDPDGLARLLRYLESLGVVGRIGRTWVPTELGELLRADARHSMRPLALLYGGPFYRSFAALPHAVRTGREGYETVFGRAHFDHFAENPSLAALFDAAMAASAPMFEPIPGLVDFTDAAVVVDIAGGNGELLGRILRHAPHLRGVLFERGHVLERARPKLAAGGVADRCDFVAGDFTVGVPAGGDVYLLSRVLHDWDDVQCRDILRRCAESVRPGARLLIVERLLPEAGARSLAVPWDLHMLCNVGGRERTAAHYAELLADSGFDVTSVSALPLDGNLLIARRRAIPA